MRHAEDAAAPIASFELAERQERLERCASREHPKCLLCGQNPGGLRLHFRAQADGSVVAVFPCPASYQSYPQTLHGGVIASLLDAAMTNALFADGIAAVTGELTIRFLAPVSLGRGAVIRGWCERATPPLYYLRAQLEQAGVLRARASAKFMLREGER